MLSGPIPRHVAIIMDGNGRWARERNLPRPFGHRAGMKAVREAVEGARGAPARRGSLEGHEAARGHRRGGGAREALHRPLERPRSVDSHLGRAADLELPAVAAGLHRVVHDAGALARRHATRSLPGDPRLPAARTAVRQSHGPSLMSRNLLVRIAVAVPAIAVTVAVLWLGGWVLATALAL